MDSRQEADATRAAIMCSTERQTMYEVYRDGAGEMFSVSCSTLQDVVQDALGSPQDLRYPSTWDHSLWE